MYMRYQNTERQASNRSDRTPQVQSSLLNEYLRIDEPISSQLTRRGGATWATSPLVTKPLKSLPPLKPAAARRRKMDQQYGNLRALWDGLIDVLVLAADC